MEPGAAAATVERLAREAAPAAQETQSPETAAAGARRDAMVLPPVGAGPTTVVDGQTENETGSLSHKKKQKKKGKRKNKKERKKRKRKR